VWHVFKDSGSAFWSECDGIAGGRLDRLMAGEYAKLVYIGSDRCCIFELDLFKLLLYDSDDVLVFLVLIGCYLF